MVDCVLVLKWIVFWAQQSDDKVNGKGTSWEEAMGLDLLRSSFCQHSVLFPFFNFVELLALWILNCLGKVGLKAFC